jgi:hypothetical protein
VTNSEKVAIGEKPSDSPLEAVTEGAATPDAVEGTDQPSEDRGKAVQSQDLTKEDDEAAGAGPKPKRKKKNKNKKKTKAKSTSVQPTPTPALTLPPAPLLDPWPKLPNPPHDRAYTINDAPSAWPASQVSLRRDKVANLISPMLISESNQTAPFQEKEGGGSAKSGGPTMG